MHLYFTLVHWTFWLISVPLAAVEIYAFADAASRSAHLYDAYMKRTKTFWMTILGIGAVVGVLQIPIFPVVHELLLMAAVMPAAIYLADVKPTFGRRR